MAQNPYGQGGRAVVFESGAGGSGAPPFDGDFVMVSSHPDLTNAHVVSDSPTVTWEIGASTIQAHVIGGGGGGTGGVAISAGAELASSGTVIFSNSNGLAFGMAGSMLTGSYTVPSIVGLLSAFNISAGTTSQNLSALTFSNASGVSFGLNGSVITASVRTDYLTTAMQSNAATISNVNISAGTTSQNLSAFTFSNASGVSFGLNGSVITASVQTNYLTTAALSNHSHGNPTLALTNLTGTTASASNGLTLSLSAAAAVTTNGLISRVNVSAGTTSNNLSALTFSNGSGVSFGLNGSVITATVQTNYLTTAAQSDHSHGNPQLNLTNISGTTASNSAGFTLSLSAANPVGGGLTNVNISAGTTSNNLSALTFSNGSGVSFGLNGSVITATVQTNYLTTAMQSNAATISNVRVSAGTTSNLLSALTFADGSGVSFGINASTITASVKTDYQTSGAYLTTAMQSNAATISNVRISAGTTSNLLSALTFADGSGVSFGINGSTITATVQTNYLTTAMQSNAATISNIRVSAGTTSNLLSALTFADGSNVSFGINASTITASVATSLTNVRISAGTTSNLLSALTFADGSGVSFGINGSTITATVQTNYLTTAALSNHSHGNPQLNLTNLSGTTASNSAGFTLSLSAADPSAGGLTNIRVSAGTTSNLLSALTFADGSNVSFGINASTITASVASSLTNMKLSAGTSSTNLSAVTFSDSNGVSFGLNGSTMTGSIGSYSLIFQNSNGITFGTSSNGSTTSVTAIAGYLSFYENLAHMGHEITQTLNGVSISHVVAFVLPCPGSFSFLRIPAVFTAGSTSRTVTAASMSASVERYTTFNAVVYSMNTGASSKSLVSVTSSSVGWTFRNSVSIAANGTQGSYTQGLSCAAEGNGTTLTTQYSVSNLNSYQFSSTAFSDFSGSKFLDIHFGNSLSAGAYWLVFGYSSSSATNSTGMSAASNCNVGYSNHYGISQANIAFGILGSTNATSGAMLGAGSFSTAGGGTTSGFPISAISSSASHIRNYFQLVRSA